jgi:hypothetical protein
MKQRIRTTLAAVGAAAVLTATGLGVAASKHDSSDSASAATQQAVPAGRGAPGATNQAGLAKALGVSTAKLQKAMQANRPTSGQGGGPQQMAANLAKALGLPTSKVQKALEANRPSGAPGAPS